MRRHLRVACLLAFLAPLQLHAADAAPAGYEPVKQAVTPKDPSRILVEEFFWYGCPHCYALEPALENWAKAKPADVDFQPVPLSLGREVGVLHAKVYYAEVLLGVQDKVHRALFDAIHRDNASLSSPDELEQFLATKAGLSLSQMNAALDNFMIESNVQRAEDLAAQYGVFSTPTIVVGGAYKVDAGTPEQKLKVVDELIEKVRRERATAKAMPAPAVVASATTVHQVGPSRLVWLVMMGVGLVVVFSLWAVRAR